MIKCELIIDGYSYKITNDVMNWDDVTISLKRGNYDGVVRSFSSKFEFVNTAYSLLKKQYQDSYLGAAASIVISKRNNSWTWNELFRCTLDFSTYSDDGRVIAINAIDDTLAAIIKAKKSIQYEYPVADLHSENLHYDRLSISNMARWIITGDTVEKEGKTYVENTFSGSGKQTIYTIPIYVEEQEIAVKDIVEIYDVGKMAIVFEDYEGKYFLKNVSNLDLNVNIKINFEIYAELEGAGTSNIRLESKASKSDVLFYKPLVNGKNMVDFNGSFIMSPNMIIYFGVMTPTGYTKLSQEINNEKKMIFEISYLGRQPPANIDIVPLDVLANKLISSMAGEGSPYGVVISNYLPDMRVDRLSNTYIMAAESARGIPKAKLYTSFNKFTDFMEAEFGYVPVIKGNTIEFVWRNDLYTSMVQKNLGSAVNDYQYIVNSSLIYSSVKAGYDKQDYDSINGRDEFRFTNEFSTGLTLTENSFSLISPYRGDAYGIEFLVQKRGEDTTDSDSDNDTFIVGCIRDGLKYILKRNYAPSLLKGMISPETMFNIEYSPRFMLDANKSYIGACTKHLKFTSSNGNSDISINGIKETDDLVIDSALFTVGEIEVETSDIEVQDELNGLVSLTYNGNTATGYIKQLKINAGKEESVKYSLIVKDIKN